MSPYSTHRSVCIALHTQRAYFIPSFKIPGFCQGLRHATLCLTSPPSCLLTLVALWLIWQRFVGLAPAGCFHCCSVQTIRYTCLRAESEIYALKQKTAEAEGTKQCSRSQVFTWSCVDSANTFCSSSFFPCFFFFSLLCNLVLLASLWESSDERRASWEDRIGFGLKSAHSLSFASLKIFISISMSAFGVELRLRWFFFFNYYYYCFYFYLSLLRSNSPNSQLTTAAKVL